MNFSWWIEPLQKNIRRRSVSLVALAVAVGFIEVAVSVACPAVPAEAIASPSSLEESIRKSVRGRGGQQLLVRLSRQLSGTPDISVPQLSADHPCALAARAMHSRARLASRMAPPPESCGFVRVDASTRSGRAPPFSSCA